jgi:predicted aspartyl protease
VRYPLTSAGIVAATVSLAWALGGCAPAGASRMARADAPMGATHTNIAVARAPEATPPSSGERRAALLFEAAGRPFPLPLVEVLVAGVPTTMILDTGATRHVVADWLVREAGLPTRASNSAVSDHTGKAMSVLETDSAALRLAGWGAVPASSALLVGALPEPLRRLGIAGVVAPALCGAADALVLDMPARAMIETSLEKATARWGRAGKALSGPDSMRGCLTPAGGALYVVEAEVGGVRADLEIDTGAADSDLKDTSAAGRALSPRAVAGEQTWTAGGSFTSRILRATTIRAGEVEMRTDVVIAPDGGAGCRRDGFLGMDVLGKSVIVLAGERTFVRWMP